MMGKSALLVISLLILSSVTLDGAPRKKTVPGFYPVEVYGKRGFTGRVVGNP